MNNELTIQHLSAYLPYGLKVQFTQQDDGISGAGELYQIETGKTDKQLFEITPTIIVSDYELYLHEDEIKPILRPLSDLTKEDIAAFYEMSKSESKNIEWEEWAQELKYLIEKNYPFQLNQFTYLFSMHFDVFGLIKKGLAIDINTIHK